MGQMTIWDLRPTKEELDRKYDIPRDHQKEEGWTDDWHYTEIETPEENNIYYCIFESESGYWHYTYMAWAFGHWWKYAGFGEKWLLLRGKHFENDIPFAWVKVPDLYYQRDESFWSLREHFVTKEAWEYEERIERLRW